MYKIPSKNLDNIKMECDLSKVISRVMFLLHLITNSISHNTFRGNFIFSLKEHGTVSRHKYSYG
jgi:hypothetical protein